MSNKNPFKPTNKGQQLAVLIFGMGVILFSMYSSNNEDDKKVFNYFLDIKNIFIQNSEDRSPGIRLNIQNKCRTAIKNSKVMKESDLKFCKLFLSKIGTKKPL